MQNLYEYKKFAILYVDDEEKSLKYFVRAFEDEFRILTAPNAQEGFKLLERHADEIGLLMTDQRMPGEKGVWLLEKARQLRPRIVRILATAYSDMEAAIAAVNTGAIYKYITKPWDPPQLDNTLKRGLEFFMVQRERDQLLQEKMSVLHNMMIADRIVSLGLLAAGLSHHIRNSLVAVKTFLDLAPSKMEEEKMDLNGLRNPDFWKEYYQNVQSQITKINNMLKDLWAASETPVFAFKDEVSIHAVVSAVIKKLKDTFAAKSVTIRNEIPESLPMIHVDKPKFDRLFELLLKDEVVSLPAGSEIVISGAAVANPKENEPEIQIRVRDNGPGLPNEELASVFERFYRGSVARGAGDLREGSGLGLAIVREIVERHGGAVRAEARLPHGLVFVIELPAAA